MSALLPGAVLFDLDGLLVDSEPLWTRAEHELAAQHGGRWTSHLKEAVVGTPLDTAVPIILTGLGVDPSPAAVAEARRFLLARMVELFGQGVTLRPGAAELLELLRDAGVPLALVSSSFRVLVDAALAALGSAFFTVTVAGDEVTRGKPDPEPYLRAAARLGVPPARAVVVEDSAAGADSAAAAGCPCIAVPDVAPVPERPGRVIVRSLHDVDLPLLAGLTAGDPALRR